MSSGPIRLIIVCAGLVLSGGTMLAAGEYQQTKDGKTAVWNNYPRPGDTAIWSGDRDGEGYATGFGTLSWYTLEKENPVKPLLFARYFGNMVRGRFNGPVNVHVRKTTRHAVFIDGKKVTRWADGPVRSWRTPAFLVRQTKPANERAVAAEPEAPAEGPTRVAPPSIPSEVGPSTAIRFAADVDNSLRLVAWPPSTLRLGRSPAASSANLPPHPAPPTVANPRSLKEEVIALADAAVRRYGDDPANYDVPEPQYDPVDRTWSLFYEPKAGSAESDKHLTVAVADETKKTSIVAGR